MWSYRVIKPVDIGPVLQLRDRLQFIYVNQGGTSTDRYPCQVVLEQHFPPELKEFVDRLELGGRRARAVLRMLPRKQSIPPHTDKWMPQEYNWRRFQLPIVTHPDIIMRWPEDKVEVHLEAGTLYEVVYDRTHEVINNQDQVERIHLQIDQIDATI